MLYDGLRFGGLEKVLDDLTHLCVMPRLHTSRTYILPWIAARVLLIGAVACLHRMC